MARILVIDDNIDLLQMIRILLEDRGHHEAILSADGESGLAKALANPPDLAIVDVMMPGITGYEVVRRLRQVPSTAEIPIIILTARGQSVDRETALEAGADEFIAKPVTMSELLQRTEALLAHKSAQAGQPGGRIFALTSLRGGVGVTTLATNLGIAFAKSISGAVCLVDLCPSSGHAALQLGLRPEPNWSNPALASAGPGELSIDDHLLTHATRLRLLAAPFVPVVGEGLEPGTLVGILAALRRDFSLVVVDLPSTLSEGMMEVLKLADTIGLVVTPEPPTIQTTLGTLQVLKALADKTKLILNQVAPGPRQEDALARIFKQPFVATIPYDPAQAQALTKGRPLAASAAKSPLAQATARLAGELMQPAASD